MRVAILSSEAVPYSKTGGLADVAGALPKALQKIDVDSLLITPSYLQTPGEHYEKLVFGDLSVPWRGGQYRASVFYSEANGSPSYLIDAPQHFHRDSIYGYAEDFERFAFFGHAAIALIERLGKPVDIVHLNDWHCGFAAVKIAHLRFWTEFWRNTKTVLSIHNMAYRGEFSSSKLEEIGFGSEFERNQFALDGYSSALKGGLASSDFISTVSPQYAREIKGSEYGNGLDWLLRSRSERLVGITNGVDYEVWNPETDPYIAANFSADDLNGKAECKRDLLNQFSLPQEIDRPIIAIVSRFTAQKGIELLREVAAVIVYSGAFLVVLGSGEKTYEQFFQGLRDSAPESVGFYSGYNDRLAHMIEAGADVFVMPSRFEPCGLNQMYSLRYGTVPIVRAVGGLDDTIHDYDRVTGSGNGFKFREFDSNKFLEKIREALFAYADKDVWREIQISGMAVDNSWKNAATKYLELYQRALEN